MIAKFLVLLTLLTTPVLGQGVPSQWNYSWQGNNAQALYPGQVSIPQLGTTACIGSLNGILRAGSCGSNSILYLTTYGYKPDGATDNTEAVDAALTAASALGGNATIIVPTGVGLVGTATPIISNNIWFACEGAPGTCTFQGTATTMLQWGTTSTQVTGGGFYGIRFGGTALATQTLVILSKIFNFTFQDDYLNTNVAGLVTVGTVSSASSGVYINNLIGGVANVATPLINLINMNGLFIQNANVYSNNAIGAAVSGRNFVEASSGLSIDTISIRDSYIYLMNYALHTDVGNGATVSDIAVSNTWLDELNTSIYLSVETGGKIGSVQLTGNEITGNTGDCVTSDGGGTIANLIFSDNDIRGCGDSGIRIVPAVTDIIISSNGLKSVNTSATTTRGIYLVNATHAVVDGNVLLNIGDGFLPTYGMEFDTCNHCVITNNQAIGSTTNYALGTIATSSIVSNNPDLPPTVNNISVGASPFTHTAGARPETDCVHGGTVTDVAMNGFDTGQVAGCFALGANETLQVTYTSAPTILVTQH